MSILIGRYEFDGPFKSIDELKEKPGLYAVLHFEPDEYKLIHIAQAHNIKERIEILPKTDTSSGGTVLIAACYTPKCGRRERRIMVEHIQNEFDGEANQEKDQLISATKFWKRKQSETSLPIARSK